MSRFMLLRKILGNLIRRHKVLYDTEAGTCSICGYKGKFVNNGSRSIRENGLCPDCKASLRYRHQASIILRNYSSSPLQPFSQLVVEPSFQKLFIYEPGIIGPFRNYFKDRTNYITSYFWDGIKSGCYHNGIRCENLEQLSFDDNTFDLIISSDIFEHIRKPYAAFGEIKRVLKPGGRHIFTIPMSWPLSRKTKFRVDTSGETDIPIAKPAYHGSPMDKKGSLVYTDFGLDLVKHLKSIGFLTDYSGVMYNLTFDSMKK